MRILRRILMEYKEPIGTYKPSFTGKPLPGHLICQGQRLNAIRNPELLPLYNQIGTKYGGTGPEEFRLPDAREIVGVANLGMMVRYKHDIE